MVALTTRCKMSQPQRIFNHKAVLDWITCYKFLPFWRTSKDEALARYQASLVIDALIKTLNSIMCLPQKIVEISTLVLDGVD